MEVTKDTKALALEALRELVAASWAVHTVACTPQEKQRAYDALEAANAAVTALATPAEPVRLSGMCDKSDQINEHNIYKPCAADILPIEAARCMAHGGKFQETPATK